jgi:hypothetical protein
MKSMLLFISFSFMITSCTQEKDLQVKENPPQITASVKTSTSDSTNEIHQDSIKTDSITQIIHKKQVKFKKENPKVSYTRMLNFPDEMSSNNKPCIYQLDYSQKAYSTDSTFILERLKDLYNHSEKSFPISISCDFENGKSNEQIHYQSITFKVEFFENEYAGKPYLSKLYTLKKQNDGTFQINE